MSHAIKIQSLKKSFKSSLFHQKSVLNSISLNVPQKSIFGFLGPNGAGKSTTIKALLNFLKPDSGSLEILGKTVGKEEFRDSIGYLAEFPFFYPNITAIETLYFAGKLYNLPPKLIKERSSYLLERVNLTNSRKILIKGFSKGMQQRLGLAVSLIHNPKLLIFDEPMSGLDPIGRNLVKELIYDLKSEGKTVFFSSHILSDVDELCDNIAMIHEGELVYSGDITGFLETGKSLEKEFLARIEKQ